MTQEKDNNIHMIHITDDIEITMLSFLILVFGVIYGVAFVFVTYKILPPGDLILIVAIVLAAFCIASYNVHCTQVGQCYTWAWIYTIFVCIFVVMFIIRMIIFKGVGKPLKNIYKA